MALGALPGVRGEYVEVNEERLERFGRRADVQTAGLGVYPHRFGRSLEVFWNHWDGRIPVLGMTKCLQAHEKNGVVRIMFLIFVRCFSGLDAEGAG